MIGRRGFLIGIGALAAAVAVPARAMYTYVKRTSLPAMQWRMFNQGEPYGRSPLMDALPMMKEFNALPSEERSAAIREYGDEMIRTGEWP